MIKPSDDKERKKLLLNIKRDVRMKSQGTWPTAPRMILGAMLVAPIGILIGIYSNQEQGWHIMLSLVVGAAIGHFTSKYKTWDESIYEKLTNYQPINKEAYRDIQIMAAEDKLTSDDLLEWVNAELLVVSPREDTTKDIARKRFATKV